MKVTIFGRIALIMTFALIMALFAGCDNPVNPDGFVAVNNITNVPTSGTVGNLTLTGTVNPSNATNQTIVWSVVNLVVNSVVDVETTGATISGNTLTTTAAGTVLVRATIINGVNRITNYTQLFDITIFDDYPDIITYTAIQTGGVDGETDSAGIIFTFSDSVDNLDLTADDIIVSDAASKGSATLSGEGTSWTLSPITVNSAGLASVSIYKDGIETLTKDVIVYKAGQFTLEYWSITWEFDGGIAGVGAQHPTKIEKGAVLERPSPDPTKANHTFVGWYRDSGLTQAYNFDNSVIWGDLTLYAKWEEVIQPPVGTPITGNTLAEKLAWVLNENNVQNGQTYTIEVKAAEEINRHTLSYTSRSNITIILWTSGRERVISLSQNGSVFTIKPGVSLVLERNITLSGRGNNNNALVSINSGGKLVMNTGAKITGNISSSYNGGGVYVNGGTLTMEGGEISDNVSAERGGGVYVEDSGNFTMKAGKISSNKARNQGGGVYMGEDGTFTMSGGEISYNTFSSSRSDPFYGGGVYIGEDGTFTMSGGKISYNTFTSSRSDPFYGGGVYMGKNGTFTMSGGEISDNSLVSTSGPSCYGGGVYMGEDGTFTMEGGEISGNTIGSYTSYSFGGGVYMGENGAFTMSNGKISGNLCGYYYSNGGGVYVRGGTFTMEGGEISGNYTSSSQASSISRGGGVYVNDGTATMSGTAKISGNFALNYSGHYNSSYGGGVYVSGGTFTMEGGEISGNTASGNNTSDVYYGPPTSSTTRPYSSFGGGVYVDYNGTFTMASGKISGNTVSSSARSNFPYYYYSYGGGVYVSYNSTFNMEDGEISGNTASTTSNNGRADIGASISYGGGVYVGGNDNSLGSLTIRGGKISDNTAYSSSNAFTSYSRGGGVCVKGTITMNGTVKISGNTAMSDLNSNGGGVYVEDMGNFTMNSGEISGNTTGGNGGGVYIYSGGTFTMHDGEISGNTASNTSQFGGTSSGGGVYGSFTMENGKISGNTALTSGGGVSAGGTFTKSNGTIYGYSASDTINSNVVKRTSGLVENNQGHAVYVDSSKRRETTAGPDVNLDASISGTAGGWEN